MKRLSIKDLTNEQREHLDSIMDYTTDAIASKYIAGALEHGGTLSDMKVDDLVDNAIFEAIDQLVYLVTLKQQLSESK